MLLFTDIRTPPCWASNGYPRILQASGTRLGVLRLLASWTGQLLDSLTLQCEVTIVGLPRLYHVCNLITIYIYIHFVNSVPLEYPNITLCLVFLQGTSQTIKSNFIKQNKTKNENLTRMYIPDLGSHSFLFVMPS